MAWLKTHAVAVFILVRQMTRCDVRDCDDSYILLQIFFRYCSYALDLNSLRKVYSYCTSAKGINRLKKIIIKPAQSLGAKLDTVEMVAERRILTKSSGVMKNPWIRGHKSSHLWIIVPDQSDTDADVVEQLLNRTQQIQ